MVVSVAVPVTFAMSVRKMAKKVSPHPASTAQTAVRLWTWESVSSSSTSMPSYAVPVPYIAIAPSTVAMFASTYVTSHGTHVLVEQMALTPNVGGSEAMPATASAEHAPPVGSDSERRRSGFSTGLVSAVPEATAAEMKARASMFDRSAMFDAARWN